MSKLKNIIRIIAAVAYIVFLTLGIYAAYNGDRLVAMFWAITCGAESIGLSIDNIARTMVGKGVLEGTTDGKKEA